MCLITERNAGLKLFYPVDWAEMFSWQSLSLEQWWNCHFFEYQENILVCLEAHLWTAPDCSQVQCEGKSCKEAYL